MPLVEVVVIEPGARGGHWLGEAHRGGAAVLPTDGCSLHHWDGIFCYLVAAMVDS